MRADNTSNEHGTPGRLGQSAPAGVFAVHQGGLDAPSKWHRGHHIHPKTPNNRQLPAYMRTMAATVIEKPFIWAKAGDKARCDIVINA